MYTKTCILPGGYIDAQGQRHRQVRLVPFTGEAEAVVEDEPSGPALVSQILALSLTAIGPYEASLTLVRQLLVADRQYLLLQLRAVTYGARIDAVLQCPQYTCGHKMDVDFTVDDVPVSSVDTLHLRYEMEFVHSDDQARNADANDGGSTITFRLPNGTDQEALAPLLAAGDEEQASIQLLQRCVQGRNTEETAAITGLIEKMSVDERAKIEATMLEVAPGVELTMEGICPECRQAFAIPFDLENFILQELRTSLGALTREVHYLAYHYHWSEREIMSMPRPKRRRYINMLSEELEKLRYAV